MSKVLIVDDEVISIEYLKRMSSWKKYGCIQVDSAWISAKALESFKREKHSIVFMDIRMPGLDGLALSREFLRIAPDTIIVIMTAWQEFEYIKEAMQIGIKYFLIKHEITEEKLDEILNKINEERQLQKNYKWALWNNWLRGIWETGTGNQIPARTKNPCFLLVISLRGFSMLVKETKESILKEELSAWQEMNRLNICAFTRLERYTYGLVCEAASEIWDRIREEELAEFLEQLEAIFNAGTGLQCIFYLSGLKKNLEDFSEVCVKFQELTRDILWQKRRIVRENELALYQKVQWTDWIDKNGMQWREEDLKLLLYEGKKENYHMDFSALYNIKEFAENRQALSFLQEQDEKTPYVSMEQLLRGCLRFLEQESGRKNKMVQHAVAYIQKHYSEDISSASIAEELQVSDGYLRMMFKKELSCTVKNYILQYRIDRAKEFLQQDKKKIYEIATLCGFVSSQHFSRVFRQFTGMTPGEFKAAYPKETR